MNNIALNISVHVFWCTCAYIPVEYIVLDMEKLVTVIYVFKFSNNAI